MLEAMECMGHSAVSSFLSLLRFPVIGCSWNQSQHDIYRSHDAKYMKDVGEEIVEGDPLLQWFRFQLVEAMHPNNR